MCVLLWLQLELWLYEGITTPCFVCCSYSYPKSPAFLWHLMGSPGTLRESTYSCALARGSASSSVLPGGKMTSSPWDSASFHLIDLHMQNVLHFWKGFFHSALFIELATLDVDCTLKTPAEFCSLSSTFILFSSSFLCNRQKFFCVCSKHRCFNFPQSHICYSLLPMGF